MSRSASIALPQISARRAESVYWLWSLFVRELPTHRARTINPSTSKPVML